MKFTNTRAILSSLFIGFILSWGAVAMAIFLQFHAELHPCPLCIFSRLLLMGIGAIYLIWLIHLFLFKKKGHWFYFSLLAIGIGSGLALSVYHSWLMHLPPEKLPSCGPDLSYLLEVLPLHEVVIEALKGSGSCAQDKWHFLGLNFAEIGLSLYLILAGLQVYLFSLIRKK